jgi:hypothetical protein
VKISTLIAQLQQIRQDYGDIEITDLNDKMLTRVEILDPRGYPEAVVQLHDDEPKSRTRTTR